MKFTTIVATTLAAVTAIASAASPVKAEWVTGNGLISQSRDTTIAGFEVTEFEPQEVENGSVKYYYLTKSAGKDIAGVMIVRNMYRGVISGVFTDVSTDHTQGCYGRFEIKEAAPMKFNATWHVDGKVKNLSCPASGTSVTLPNMTLGSFTRWVEQ